MNRNISVKPLYYGAYSSFAPCVDSTFSNLTKAESEMVRSTYGEETGVQYAERYVVKYILCARASVNANKLYMCSLIDQIVFAV